MKKNYKLLFPSGMIGVLFYLTHTITGRILRKDYNPVTTDISSLTADGAPYAGLLKVFTVIYGIFMLAFVAALIKKSFEEYNGLLKTGFIILMVMQLTSMFGFMLFPLTANPNEMSFQDVMHIVVTVIVVFSTIVSSFLIAAGYLKQKKTKALGKFSLIMAILITVFGASSPITANLKLKILGLTERLTVYTIQAFMFILSFYYTYTENKKSKCAAEIK